MSSVRRADPVERFILRLAAFEPLEAPAREALRRAVKSGTRVAASEMQRRHAPTEMCILLDGWVCHFKLVDNGRRQITALVVPGDMVDFGFLTGRTAHLQFRTTISTQFGSIPVAQFEAICAEHPAVMRAVLCALATEAAIRDERVMSLGVRRAEERLSHLLCELRYRLNVVGLVEVDGSFDLPMTQSDLAETLGLSTVHVNRTVQGLRRAGMITLGRGRVNLLQPERLQSRSGFDPGYLGLSPSLHTRSGAG